MQLRLVRDHRTFVHHVYRERNVVADQLCKDAIQGDVHCRVTASGHFRYFRLQTDGSLARNGPSSTGGCLWASNAKPGDSMLQHECHTVGTFAIQVDAASAFEAELQALLCGIAFLRRYQFQSNCNLPVSFLDLQSIATLL